MDGLEPPVLDETWGLGLRNQKSKSKERGIYRDRRKKVFVRERERHKRERGGLGRTQKFRILLLLRNVVHISKSSPNPKFC